MERSKRIEFHHISSSQPELRSQYANAVKLPAKDIDLDKVFDNDGLDQYLQSLRDGTFEIGLSTGSVHLDKKFRFKRRHFNVINGYDNTGKSSFLWFMMLIAAKRHGWKWIVFTGENSKGSFYRRCIEYLNTAHIREIPDAKHKASKLFIDEHFAVMRNDDAYTYQDILTICAKKREYFKCDGILIDPYNSLDEAATNNTHSYHYKACLAMQHFTRKNDCCIYLNCHAISGAYRKLDNGYSVAPNKADTEGGTKFASKADDFLTVHRLTNHEKLWRVTEIHVRKIKEIETGGMVTMKNAPVLFQMLKGSLGFVDQNNWNPLTEKEQYADWRGVTAKHVAIEDDDSIHRIKPPPEPEPEQEELPW